MNNTRHINKSARIAAVSLALGIAALASSPGFAADSVKVKRSSNPEVTYTRLQQAAAQLCGSVSRIEVARYNVWVKCYERNLESAVEQMHEPVLLAIHLQHVASGTTFAG
jgi:hypothetical protein